MSDPMVVRPVRRGRFAIPFLMLLVGIALGVGLDRAFLGMGPMLSGKPKLVGVWVDRLGKNPIEFNADGSFAWEIPFFNMSGEKTTAATDSRRLTKWKWIDAKTIELESGYYGEKNVKWGIVIEGDLMRISEADGSVKEYRRKQ